MQSKRYKRTILLLMLGIFAAVAFAMPESFAATGTTKASTADKPKKVAINIAVMAEADAEVKISVEKVEKKKNKPLERTVNLKKGGNYFTYNKGKKGIYRVTINAFGDSTSQTVTAVKGEYTLLFNVAPPKDGDEKKAKPIVYQDLTKIKDKK